jgi:hypothetical protein
MEIDPCQPENFTTNTFNIVSIGAMLSLASDRAGLRKRVGSSRVCWIDALGRIQIDAIE